MIRRPRRGSLSASSLIGERVTGRSLFTASPPGWHVPISPGATFSWEPASNPPRRCFWGRNLLLLPGIVPSACRRRCCPLRVLAPSPGWCQHTAAASVGAEAGFWHNPGRPTRETWPGLCHAGMGGRPLLGDRVTPARVTVPSPPRCSHPALIGADGSPLLPG